MKTNSKILAVVMAFIMIIGLVPIGAFAENDLPATNTDTVVENPVNNTEETTTPSDPGELPRSDENMEQGDNEGDLELPSEASQAPVPENAEDEKQSSAAIFTVTFDENGHGVAPDTVTVTEGSLIKKPSDLSEDDHAFTGWYRDKEATNQWNFDTDTATDNIILYAGWMEIPSAPAPVDDTLQDKEEEETVTKPMLRSAPPALNAPLQNGGLRAGQTFYLDLKYEGSGSALASTYTGTEGTVVSINAYPTDGYRFRRWELLSGTGSIGDEDNANTTFTMGTTDATVKAVFEILPAGGNSLVCFAHSGGTASATVNPNDPTTYALTATPASGYQFEHWYISQGSGNITDERNASTTITGCSGFVVVEAHFSTITYPITTNANPDVGGSAERLPYNGGPAQNVNLTATPNAGYVLKEWKITSGAGTIRNPKDANTVLENITGEVTCEAVFEAVPASMHGVHLTKNYYYGGEVKASASYGSPGTAVTLTATPASGYRFTRWEVTPVNVVLADSNSATTTFQIGSEDVTVKAVFIPDTHDYNITTQTYGCGRAASINASPSGSRVRLDAYLESGWSFDHWEVVDGGVTLDNENARIAFFVMRDQDVVVRAVFVPDATNPLREIKVTNPPKKDTYTAGESFDPDGMVVTAYYQNGTTDVSGYTYEPSGALAETDKNITISYTVNGVTKTTTQAITVAPATVYAIVYHLSDGTNHPSNPATYTKFDTITLANPKRDGYTFGGWYDNAEFNGSPVTEIPAGSSGDKQFFAKWSLITVTGITLDSENAKKEYFTGEKLDLNGLVLTAKYSDGSEKKVDVTASMVSGFDSSKIGKQTVTVTYENSTATYEIEVKAKVAVSYAAKDGAGNAIQSVTWQKGSGKSLNLTFHRSKDDHLTYGLFGSLEIGGSTVGSANYDAAEGSLKLSIKPEYLETLSVGDHTVKVNFRDGSAMVKLTVKAAPDPNVPRTADEGNPTLWSGLMLLSAAMLVLLPIARKRKTER